MDISGTFLWRKKVVCSVTAKLPIISDASFLGITCYYRPQGSQSSLSYNLYNNCKSRLFGKFEKKISRRILGETYLWNLAAKCPFAPNALTFIGSTNWLDCNYGFMACLHNHANQGNDVSFFQQSALSCDIGNTINNYILLLFFRLKVLRVAFGLVAKRKTVQIS